jgi:photosystem II stability/assembly factor-like uncharacterized protein
MNMMNRILLLLTFTFINSVNLPAQQGWVVHNTGINTELNNIMFINSNTGFLVGDTNIVFKSTNGGLNWAPKMLPLSNAAEMFAVAFINQNTGYAGGGHHWSEFIYARYLLKTTNCGENWTLLYYDSLYSMNGAIVNIIPFNENEILVSNAGYIEVFNTGGIYKSTNGGLNFTSCISGGSFRSISFLNQNTGYAVNLQTTDFGPSVSKILKTTNGCSSWIVQHRDSAYGAVIFSKIQAFDSNNSYALGSVYTGGNTHTRFFRTTNSGAVWIYTQEVNSRNRDLFFINPSTGWVGGYMGQDSSVIAYTNNAGLNWTLQKKNFISEVVKLFFINENTGWAVLYDWGVTQNMRILKTTTGGLVNISHISEILPSSYSLSQNYPNPFNPETKIKISVPLRRGDGGWNNDWMGLVRLTVYDALGREVETLVNEALQPGTYEVTFNGSRYNSGVYFYSLVTDGFTEAKRMLLIK